MNVIYFRPMISDRMDMDELIVTEVIKDNLWQLNVRGRWTYQLPLAVNCSDKNWCSNFFPFAKYPNFILNYEHR